MSARSWLATLACVILADCSSYDERTITRSEAPKSKTAEYYLKTAAKDGKLSEPLEVTAVRQAHLLSPGDWVACVKSAAPGSARYAVFFNGETPKGARLAVQIDPCGDELFEPMKP
jgi:hypothetical protein